MVEPTAIFWKIPVSYLMEYIVKNYDPVWVASPPTVPISPLLINPLTYANSPVPAYDNSSCPYVAPITWTQTKFVLNPDGTQNIFAYVAPTTSTSQSSMVFSAYN